MELWAIREGFVTRYYCGETGRRIQEAFSIESAYHFERFQQELNGNVIRYPEFTMLASRVPQDAPLSSPTGVRRDLDRARALGWSTD